MSVTFYDIQRRVCRHFGPDDDATGRFRELSSDLDEEEELELLFLDLAYQPKGDMTDFERRWSQ